MKEHRIEVVCRLPLPIFLLFLFSIVPSTLPLSYPLLSLYLITPRPVGKSMW